MCRKSPTCYARCDAQASTSRTATAKPGIRICSLTVGKEAMIWMIAVPAFIQMRVLTKDGWRATQGMSMQVSRIGVRLVAISENSPLATWNHAAPGGQRGLRSPSHHAVNLEGRAHMAASIALLARPTITPRERVLRSQTPPSAFNTSRYGEILEANNRSRLQTRWSHSRQSAYELPNSTLVLLLGCCCWGAIALDGSF